MSKLPFMPIYVDAFGSAVAHLTLCEEGAYFRLLRLCWETPRCTIPNDHKWIARKLRVSASEFEEAVAPILEEFFSVRRGRYFQKRLLQEYVKANDMVKARSEAGKKGAAAKHRKTKEKDPGKRKTNAKQTDGNLESQPHRQIPEAKASVQSQPEFELESPQVDEVGLAYDAYVQTAKHLRDQNRGHVIWPIPNTLTEKRRGHINARLNEVGLKGWRRMLSLAASSEFLSQRPPRNFDLDWVSNPDNFTKISEGKYNDRKQTGNVTPISRPRPEPASSGSAFLDGAYEAADTIDHATLPRRDGQELHRAGTRAAGSFERGDEFTIDAHVDVVAG